MTSVSPSDRRDAVRFVGRTEELAAVRLLFETPLDRAAFVIVDGEPGIGKSRLLQELAAWGSEQRFAVLSARVADVGAPLPLNLVFDLLGDIRDNAVTTVPAAPADATDVFHRLAPAVGGRVDRGSSDRHFLGVERYQLYRAVQVLLESIGPALVMIDDLQWADDASVELLDFLARHPPHGQVVFVLAHRSGHGSLRLRQSLNRVRPAVTTLTLSPLSMTDIADWFPAESPARRRRLYEASCGNPLFLEILSAAGDDRTVLELGRAPSVIDDRVAVALDQMIRSDLRGLPEPEQRVATAAAVTGDDSDPVFIAHVAELPVAETIAAIDVLVRRDVLRHAGTHLVFRHPLVRAAAYGLAGPAWRFAAHRRAVAYLAAAGASAVRQAQHLEYASSVGDEAATDVLAAAAADVLETAPSGSVRWLYAALRTLPERPETRTRRTQLHLMLARALYMCGRLGESKELLRTLLDPGTDCRHEALELLAATERLLGRLPQARRLLLGELARADDELDEASIRLELAATEVLGGHLADAECNAHAVLSLVDGGAHPEIAAAADTLLALVRVLGGGRAEAGEQLARAQWVVDGLDDVALRGMLDLIAPLAWVELMTERYDAAMRHLDRGITVARRYGRNHVMPDLYLVRSIASGRAGQIGAALRDAEDAEEMALLVGGLELRWLAAVMRLRPLLWRNGPAEARALLDQVRVSQPLRSPWWRSAAATMTAEVALDLGDIDLCRDVLRVHVGPDAPASGAVAELRLLARADLLSGDLPAARELFERASRAGEDSGLRGELAALALIEAELLSAEGKVVDAIDATLRAALDARGAGMPVREGQARVILGELHHRAGDPAASRVEFGKARDLFSDSGADWLVSQVGSAIRRLSAGRPRTRPRPLGAPTLSAREREVAVMVAEGLTNRAIADRLFLSPRTVDAHLARIFTKFGVSTRAALVQIMGSP